jgi:hypothetical protein
MEARKKAGNSEPPKARTGPGGALYSRNRGIFEFRPLICPNMTLFLIMHGKPYQNDTKKPGPSWDRALRVDPYSIMARMSCILRIRCSSPSILI